MPKKKPDEWKKEGDELKATIMSAKKKPQNFGLVIANEGMILKTHPTHSTDKLFKEAKSSDGGSAKGIKGVMTVNGTQIEFKYEGTEKDIPGGFQTKFKQYLTLVKVKGFKAEFLPDAAPAEAKKADEKQAAEEPKPAPKAKPEPAEAQEKEEKAAVRADAGGEISKDLLAKNFKHVTNIFKLSFDGMEKKEADELKGALKNIGAAISGGDLTGAQNMMNKLELLTGVGPNSPMQAISLGSGKKKEKLSPEEAKKKKKKLTKEVADVKSELKGALSDFNKTEQAQLQKLIKDFGKHMKSDDLDDAEDSLEQIHELVEEFRQLQVRKAERANQMSDLEQMLKDTLAAVHA